MTDPALEKLKELAYCGGQFYFKTPGGKTHHTSEFSEHCGMCRKRLAELTPAYTLGLSQGQDVEREKKLYMAGVEFGYRQANSDRALRQTLDEAEKNFHKQCALAEAVNNGD